MYASPLFEGEEMKEKILKPIFLRRLVVAMMLLTQMVFVFALTAMDSMTGRIVSGILTVLSVVAAVYIISNREKGAYKLTWVFIILVFPVFGTLFYLFFQLQPSKKKFAKILTSAEDFTSRMFFMPGDAKKHLEIEDDEYIAVSNYLQDYMKYPVFDNTRTEYLSNGKDYFRRLKNELKKAEKYIFLEYFIIAEGRMWNEILEILKEKADQGVLVRVMYDDVGSLLTLPHGYKEYLESIGIECEIFNPFQPLLTTIQNNRDHRKIVSIDGKVAFTGGVNLADEYIGEIERFGHWKDCGIVITGKAAWSFTMMFLQLWNVSKNMKEDYAKYYPWYEEFCHEASDGYVQPYTDSPTDSENVSEHVYMQAINRADKYVYICTPYLIIDDSMVSSLILAAKSGVDVRIITPAKWDKWLVHKCTRSYYRDLILGGVKIYEYSPGFIHSKILVSDDKVATVGTVNFDFRSLYLHFECGTWLNGVSAIKDIKNDVIQTLSVCKKIEVEDCCNNIIGRLAQQVLRVLAPLL